MPHVQSIGLGGGSRVRKDGTGKVTVGPDSVGYKIQDSLSFGGTTLTATDIIVALGKAPGVGDEKLVKHLEKDDCLAVTLRIKTMLELVLDEMKTSVQDIPVYLVGGGAILAPESLRGVSQVHRFPHYDAANAVGAACAQVCDSPRPGYQVENWNRYLESSTRLRTHRPHLLLKSGSVWKLVR